LTHFGLQRNLCGTKHSMSLRLTSRLLAALVGCAAASLAPASTVAATKAAGRPHLRIPSGARQEAQAPLHRLAAVAAASAPAAVQHPTAKDSDSSAAPKASMVDMKVPGELASSLPPSGQAMVAELRQEIKEVKQHRTNIVQLQQALTADVALLRESSALQRVSATRHSKNVAKAQVRKSEQVVKEMSAMLRDSKREAAEDTKSLLAEATDVRAAADALAAEATAQLHLLSGSGGGGRAAAQAPTQPAAPAAPVAAASPLAPTGPATLPTAAAAADLTEDSSDDSM